MRKTLLFLFVIIYLLQARSQNWAAMVFIHPNSTCHIQCMYNDTTTNILYAGGLFDTIDGKHISGIARWDGVKWDSLDVGIDRTTDMSAGVRKIIGYHGKIYVFGNFNKAGGYQMNGMGIWNGTSWDSIPDVPNGIINDAYVYNDTLYICGNFFQIGSLSTRWAAKFDGTNWYAMDFPYNINSGFTSIRMFNGKGYAAGTIYSNGYGLLAEWDGTTWIPWAGVQGNVNKSVWGLEVLNNQLFVYGHFWQIGSIWSPGIVSWDGTTWYGYGGGVTPTSYATIREIAKINNQIHVVGGFGFAGGQGNSGTGNMYAVWDGIDWCVTNDTIDNLYNCITTYNNEIVVGGGFWSINGDSSITRIAKWIGLDGFDACGNQTGIKNISSATTVKLFPNPATNQISLSSYKEIELNSVSIYNAIGEQLTAKTEITKTSNTSVAISISQLPAGFYFVNVNIEGENLIKKFIKE